MDISTFTYKDTQFDVTFKNGYLAYSFHYNGKDYGNKVKPSSKKTLDLSSAAFLLAANAIETYEDLRLREGNTSDRPKTDDSTK